MTEQLDASASPPWAIHNWELVEGKLGYLIAGWQMEAGMGKNARIVQVGESGKFNLVISAYDILTNQELGKLTVIDLTPEEAEKSLDWNEIRRRILERR